MTKTFIIAEAGINHKGDLGLAKALVEAAKDSGADAIKFQTYTTEKRTYVGSPIWDILKQCELSYEQHRDLKEHADAVGIEYFSTPFDEDALKFLVEELGIRRVKVASFDVTNLKFLDAVNEYGSRYYNYKVILSTGMSNSYEIEEALKHLNYVAYLTLLHCKSSYPLADKDVNLQAIRSLKGMLSSVRSVGFSDHTKSVEIPAMAVLVGATTIEKHFTLDYDNDAVDNPVSLNPKDFRNMAGLIRRYEEILGDGHLGMDECENGAKSFRRHS